MCPLTSLVLQTRKSFTHDQERNEPMPRLRFAPLAAALALAAAGSACGGKGGSSSSTTSPTAPGNTPPPSSSNVCRTYPTAANVHTTTSGSSVVFDALEAAVFDAAARTATVRTNFANGAPCSTLVSNYNSVADFVDEVSVIPPIFRTTSSVSTNSGSCGSTAVTQTFTYDSQRRLTRLTNSAGGVLTYTAWDTSGRPTSGTNNGGGTISITYNDPARSWTETQTTNGALTTSTATFNPDGSQATIVVVQGGVTTTTTFTNTATAQVCK
jgi:hypothetical protein